VRLLLLRHLELWGGELVQIHRDVEAELCQAVHHRRDVLDQSFLQCLIDAEIFCYWTGPYITNIDTRNTECSSIDS